MPVRNRLVMPSVTSIALCLLLPAAALADHKPKQQLVTSIPADLQTCVPEAPAGYHHKACLVVIDRDSPVSPPTVLIPGGTAVYVKLDNPRWDESVTFNAAVSESAFPKYLSDALASLNPTLSSLQFSYHAANNEINKKSAILGIQRSKTLLPSDQEWEKMRDQIDSEETAIAGTIKTIHSAVQELACFENYKQFDAAGPTCVQSVSLDHNTVKAALDSALQHAISASLLTLPDLADLKANLAALDVLCGKLASPVSTSACRDASGALHNTETSLEVTIKVMPDAQKALTQASDLLSQIKPVIGPLYFESLEPFRRTAVITVTGTEVVTKTVAAIASFTINWMESGFVLSTGLMGSGLANKSYAVSSIISNGAVQTDPATGKNLTIVTATSVQPAMDFPVVYGSWVVPWINRFKWQNACPGHCTFLLSAGAALNLSSKTADLAIGPSFQIWGVLITPSLVWGKQTVLLDGITVGYTGFGITPPSSLPTGNVWKKAFGIALTYAIPTP